VEGDVAGGLGALGDFAGAGSPRLAAWHFGSVLTLRSKPAHILALVVSCVPAPGLGSRSAGHPRMCGCVLCCADCETAVSTICTAFICLDQSLCPNSIKHVNAVCGWHGRSLQHPQPVFSR